MKKHGTLFKWERYAKYQPSCFETLNFGAVEPVELLPMSGKYIGSYVSQQTIDIYSD